MGVITNGSISGNLPEAEAFAVNYPGYPSSTARAIDTLGGTEGILKARISQSNYLELRFRPEDPYSHPAFGELRPCSGLLLRISKKKCADGKEAAPPENRQNYSSEGIPKESEDGQVSSQSGIQVTTVNEERDVQVNEAPASSIQLSADIVARVPQAYHFDGMVDYQYVLAVHADVERRRKRNWTEVETRFEKGGLMDLDQEDLMYLVPPLFSPKDIPENLVLTPSANLNSKRKQVSVVRKHWEFIKIPKKINWEDNIPQGSASWEWQMVMSKLFDERPIWPRRSVCDRLLDNGLRVSDDHLKRYQRVDFRTPPQLRNSGGKKAVDGHRATFGWLGFIHMVHCRLSTSGVNKPRLTGWFSKIKFEILRLRVAMRFLSLCPRDGAKGLLKSVTERFERFKRLEIHGRGSTPNEEGNRQVIQDSSEQSSEIPEIRSNSTEMACNDDDHEAEDEEEEEEEEEYGLLHGIFGALPFTKDGSDDLAQDVDMTDGEYQIYEQDSDGDSDSY
ncbi:hypothetical protein ACLOJK_030711 [Asimina triloba]